MSKQYPSGFITKNPVVPSGSYANSSASGVWTLTEQAYWQKQNLWPIAGNFPNYVENTFSSYLYQGNSISGGSQTIVTGINSSANASMVWIKERDAANNHVLFDTIRGATKYISPNTTNSQTTNVNTLTAFTSTGFSVGNNALVNNENNLYVAWTFRKQAKFFDIVSYTGTGSNTTVAHNLGSVPGCIMVRNTASGSWQIYHSGLTSAAYGIQLNSTAAQSSDATLWNSTAPTSSVFSLGTNADVNASGSTYVAYIFASNAGGFGLSGSANAITCGTFTTNGSSTFSPVTLGYEPQWLLVKCVTDVSNWVVVDNMRGIPTGSNSPRLLANTVDTETGAGTYSQCNLTATGFSAPTGGSNPYSPSLTYMYIAVRRGPMAIPTVGTSVYSGSTNGDTNFITTNFVVDMFLDMQQSGTSTNTNVAARLQGQITSLTSSSTAGEVTTTLSGTPFQYNNGYIPGAGFSPAFLNAFQRAPSFMDVVCYTATGSNATQSHNLTVVPELMIVKRRSGAANWAVYSSALANTEYLVLNTTAARATDATVWNSTTPTSSVFSIGTNGIVNQTSATYIAYLFATTAGVSKVGTYTGTAATQTINCGFTSSARFILIKRIDSTGDWYYWNSAMGFGQYGLLNSSGGITIATYVATASNGFQVLSAAPAGLNASGGTYIFMAIA